MTLLGIGIATSLLWLGLIAFVDQAMRRIRLLSSFLEPAQDETSLPRVSIVVPAHNEEEHVDRALRSLLNLDYPDYEVIFVNDRSTDRTGEIADGISAEDGRLTVIHLTDLPTGWFGTNHARTRGGEVATGEILLMTDADVILEPQSLKAAVRFMMSEDLDHLTALAQVTSGSALVLASLFSSLIAIVLLCPPWKVANPRSSTAVGIGSFYMLRRKTYLGLGGHRRIALSPNEDMQLAKLVKLSGGRSETLNGLGMVSLEFCRTVREVVRSFEKNFFALLDFRYSRAALFGAGLLWMSVAPFVMIFVTDGATRWLFVASASLCWMMGIGGTFAYPNVPWWSGVLFPLGVVVKVYALWSSIVLIHVRGLTWGGVRASMQELRASRPEDVRIVLE